MRKRAIITWTIATAVASTLFAQLNPQEAVLALGDRSIAVLKDGKVTLPLGPAWLYNSEEARYLVSGDVIPELDP